MQLCAYTVHGFAGDPPPILACGNIFAYQLHILLGNDIGLGFARNSPNVSIMKAFNLSGRITKILYMV